MQASLYGLFDPDRSRSPLRAGEPATLEAFATAWGEIVATHLADQGAGLAVLGEPFSSPTLARLKKKFAERFPQAMWVTYEPWSDENRLEGIRLATGGAYQAVQHFDRAAVVLSIDSDFLASEPESVRQARGFADGRRLASPGDTMNRLYVVESTLTATGVTADHRKPLPPSRMAAVTLALAGELAARGLALELTGGAPSATDAGIDPKWLSAVAQDLLAHRGSSLITAGSHLSPEVHANVLRINAALGNVGATLILHDLPDAALSSGAALADLTAAMSAGRVRTLVLIGGNPVYDAPADLDFATALAKVETTIHFSDHVNETTRGAKWHVPRAHYLESWGDARAAGGCASVVQPLIAPLFGAPSDVEFFALLAEGAPRPGLEVVRETWSEILAGRSFEREWNGVLHDGLLAGSDLPPLSPEIAARIEGRGPGPRRDGPELRFMLSYAVHDGRFANVAWLQELPDPATKLTWDNAALVSPATARALGVEKKGDVVRLTCRERSLEIPAYVLPGQPDDVVTVALGYGRTAAGRVGNGVGFDAYRLRTSGAAGFDTDLRVEPTGASHLLVSTQDHWVVDQLGIDERERRLGSLVRSGTLDELHADPEFVTRFETPHPPLESLWHERPYDEGPQWGMTIDLNSCVGCNACVVACQSENNIPAVGKDQVFRGREMQWIRIDRYFSGYTDDPEGFYFQPVTCMHCENAPCEQVCPVAATVHDAQGLNVMVYNRCIGTRYCSNNCPYKVRRFNFYNFTKDTPELLKMAYNPDVTVRSRGVMEKCTFCTQRINRARLDAKLAGTKLADGDFQTACQQACPARAIEFGNLRDPGSKVAVLQAQGRAYKMLDELNNKPRTSYLARIHNPNPALAGESSG
jgi:molybdopterin-containing oxidoreductase family iron-sulfur binding subunit